jgi:putative membrane protein
MQKEARIQLTGTETTRNGFKDYFWVAARGYCMGAADVVPGVSGGTMAFILGIYEELLQAIHAVDLTFIRRLVTFRIREAFADFPWRFLLSLVLGIATAILTLARGLSWALDNHPTLVWSFFFGLVLASVFVVRKRVRKWSLGLILVTFLAAVGAYLLVGVVPVETPNDLWFLFISGAIAVNAMILPGISGAFILVLLGKYQYMLDAVVQANILALVTVIAGAGVGLISFARVLRWLFNNYHDYTVAALIGLIIGALRKLWPWKEVLTESQELHYILERNVLPGQFTTEVALALLLMASGFGVVLVLDYLASDRSGAGNKPSI